MSWLLLVLGIGWTIGGGGVKDTGHMLRCLCIAALYIVAAALLHRLDAILAALEATQ